MRFSHTRNILALLLIAVLPLGACSLADAQSDRQIAKPVIEAPLPLTRITGADIPETTRFGVYGTDLLISYRNTNGSTNYLAGDTCMNAVPSGHGGCEGWRSPVMLRSNQAPEYGKRIVFDSAAGIQGEGIAPAIMANGYKTNGEYTVIPTDGISFPETGDHIVSYMSVREWTQNSVDPLWTTNYAGLAYSRDGNHFERVGLKWNETPGHDSPHQMMSMQRDGDYVYIISVRAGRRPDPNGPMLLKRVPWNNMFDASAYECWQDDGTWGNSGCTALLRGAFGEPSLRLLGDTWAMSYLDVTDPYTAQIVTRYAPSPTGPWSEPKTQVTTAQLKNPYGGSIWHGSTKDKLVLVVSTLQPGYRYDVSLFFGTL